ncbi:methyltransferase domain-containing protein [Chloroflexi bacterium TSY]|nr:methyltransferase domain-containing protein [Chloroflexi bacterium TSY]
MSGNTTQKTLEELDAELSERYGDYVGFDTDASPYLVEYYGEDPLGEVKRLLAQSVQAESKILDVGCGPGHTLCKFAPKVVEAWGIDEDAALLEAARTRVDASGLSNVTLIHGNIVDEAQVNQLPDNTFDIAFTESGPNLNAALARKLKENALFFQEIGGYFSAYQFHEIMGRKPHTYYAYGHDYSDQILLNQMAELDFVPISVKNYFFDWYFRDVDHLEAQVINVPWQLGDWRMGGPLPYERERDRAALELYARYNTTSKGIRFQEHVRVFAWRREHVHFYPVQG